MDRFPLPCLAIEVVFSPGSPLNLRSPVLFHIPPLKPPSGPSGGGLAPAPGAGDRPRLRPRAGPRPSRHLRASAQEPPELSPPTPRLLCCSSWPCSQECTGLAEPSPAPLRRRGEGLGEDRRRRRSWRGGAREPGGPGAPRARSWRHLMTPGVPRREQEMGEGCGPELLQ